MFAIIKTGGKQYKVVKHDIVKVDKIDGEPGAQIEFDQILMIGDTSKASIIGTPIVKGACVKAEITKHFKDNKIIVFKKKRRQNYRRKHGHRQEVTELKILDITKK